MNKSILQIKNVKKTFKKGVTALDNVSVEIEKGKFTAIMGPSGSGKSTLMNIIGLLENPTSGEYYIEDKKIEKLSDKNASLLRMKKFGFVFQNLKELTLKKEQKSCLRNLV